jgi:hypothetical protein
MLSVSMLLSVPTSEVLWCYHLSQLLQTSNRRQWKPEVEDARSQPIIDLEFKSPDFKTIATYRRDLGFYFVSIVFRPSRLFYLCCAPRYPVHHKAGLCTPPPDPVLGAATWLLSVVKPTPSELHLLAQTWRQS